MSRNLYFHIYSFFYFISFGILSNICCFSTDINQFQTSFLIHRGAILLKTNEEKPSFYLLDTGVSIPIVKDTSERSKPIIKDFDHSISFLPNYQGKAIVSNLTDISKKFGITIDGILPIYYPGYEIYLDFGKGKIAWQLLSPQRKVKTKSIFCEKIYFSPENTKPKVVITLNETIAVTGNIDFVKGESLILPMSFVNERGLQKGISRFVHFQDRRIAQYFRLDTLKLGNQKFNNLLSLSVPGEKEISLGSSFWRQFVIRMSYEEASICFLKMNFSKEQEWIGVGIVPDYLDEWGWVIGVIEDSSAWENNLRGGETLIKINDWEVKNLNTDQIIHLLNSPSETQMKCEILDLSKKLRSLNLISKKIL